MAAGQSPFTTSQLTPGRYELIIRPVGGGCMRMLTRRVQFQI